jgi:hypothetical protein
MNGRVFSLYVVAMILAFALGDFVGVRSQPAPPTHDLDVTTWYPWFSSAAKMEMINTARENHVDPKVIEQMLRRANYWEEPFIRKETPQ